MMGIGLALAILIVILLMENTQESLPKAEYPVDIVDISPVKYQKVNKTSREDRIIELAKCDKLFNLSKEELDKLSNAELDWLEGLKQRVFALKQQINIRKAYESEDNNED